VDNLRVVLYGERMTHASDTAGPSIRDQVSEEIRVLMARHNWTGRKLATVTGIHEATLSRRLSGEYTFTLDELDLIAGALGVGRAGSAGRR
jgi:DNA-binding Xre family transcriptional regulator